MSSPPVIRFFAIMIAAVICTLAIMSSSSSRVDAATAAPPGLPYLDFTIRDLVLPYIYSINEQNFLFGRMLTNMSSGFLRNKAGSLNSATFQLQFKLQAVPTLRFVTYFNTPDIDNVLAYSALTLLNSYIKAGFFLPLFSWVASSISENPVTSASVGLQPLYTVYKNHWSPLLKLWLSTTPMVGKSLVVDIAPVISTLSTDKFQVNITYPAKYGWFRIFGGATPTISSMVVQINTTASTENTLRWGFDSSAYLNTITVLDYESFFITPPVSTTRAYDGQPENIFTIRANSFWRPTMDVVVTPVITPSGAGIVISPANITLTRPAVDYTFTVSAPPGTYNVTFEVPAQWTDASGEDQATDNSYFYPITSWYEITVLSTLNLAVTSIVPGFMPAEPDGSWGGAWSNAIDITLEDTAASSVTITLDTSIHGDDLEMYPSSFTFSNVNLFNTTTVYFRALKTGTYTVQLLKSGASAGDYVAIAPQTWVVGGPNPACNGLTSLATCYGANGCAWDATASSCSDVTLNITIDPIALLYAGETSPVIYLHLPTPVQSDLTINLYADNRFTFVPSTITLAAGATNASFQIIGQMDIFDDRVNVLQEFTGFLSGWDSKYYNQPVESAYVRPQVNCKLVPPQYYLYPSVLSADFAIECDQGPETNVTFTFGGATGVTLTAELPDAGGNANQINFFPENTTMKFTLLGTTISTFTLSFAIGGANAARYAAINSVEIRVVNKGYVLPPASFQLAQYETSTTLHLDLSKYQLDDTYVNISILNATTYAEITPSTATGGIYLIPDRKQFLFPKGGLPRTTFALHSDVRGRFILRFAIDGPGAHHYHDPTAKDDVVFDILDPWEGNAFRYYQTFDRYASDAKRACRLNHGYRSMEFDGQSRAVHSSDLCRVVAVRAPTTPAYNCSQHETRYRCHWALETARWPCAWVNESCAFLDDLDGNITAFSFGATFTSLLDNAGQVWTIGETTSGQLGHLSGSGILGKVDLPEPIAGIASGGHFTIAISTYGSLYSWGENIRGQLGLNSISSYSVLYGQINLPRGENATCISAGANHAGAVTLSGKAFMWGSNQYGQLGGPETYKNFSRGPVRVRTQYIGKDPVVTLHCGARYTALVTATAGYTFGVNSMGQLARVGFDEWKPELMVFDNSSSPVHVAPSYRSWVRC